MAGYAKTKGRRSAGSFATIPHAVTGSENYRKLTTKAVKLIVDLNAQIRHRKNSDTNNGDLCAAWSLMQPMGWKSKDTLHAAAQELLHYGFLQITQRGNRRNPTLYAVTWEAIGHHDHKPWIVRTTRPSELYKKSVAPPVTARTRKKPNPDHRGKGDPDTVPVAGNVVPFNPGTGSKRGVSR